MLNCDELNRVSSRVVLNPMIFKQIFPSNRNINSQVQSITLQSIQQFSQRKKQLKKISEDFDFVGNKIRVKELIRLIEQHIKGEKGENNLLSEGKQLIFEYEELIKQKVMSKKQRQQAGEELEESEQEIDDEKEQEYLLDEIRKYKEDKKKDNDAQEDYEGLSELEGDPENYQEEDTDEEEHLGDSDN